MFYHKGKKVFKLDSKYITPLALAVWVMSNGKYKNGNIELTTNFSVEKNADKSSILITMLKDRFGLVCSIVTDKKNYYVVIISKEYVKAFQDIVSPYILSNFKYKIGYRPYCGKRGEARIAKNHSKIFTPNSIPNNVIGNRYYSTNNKSSSVRSSNNLSPVCTTYANPILLKSVIYKENQKKAGIYR